MIYFSIVIPVYNEEDIEILVNEIKSVINLISKEICYETILVNDASNDNTKLILQNLKEKKSIFFYNNDQNMGQSYSIYKGIKEASYETIVTLDGDLQNDPQDLINMIDIYFKDKNLKLLGGIRKNRKDTFIKKISSYIANNIRMFILNDNCRDTGCGLKIFDRNIFLKFPFFDGIHRFLPALFNGFGHKTMFIDVNHRSRYRGYSKYGIRNRLFVGIKHMLKVRKIIRNSND